MKDIIDSILERTIELLNDAYCCNKELGSNENKESETKLVFPQYRYNESRVSEQELRFAFIEAFNEKFKGENPFFYSVEAPTKDEYIFSSGGVLLTYPIAGDLKEWEEYNNDYLNKYNIKKRGESGKFDMVIYKKNIDNNLKRVCLLEFKANDTYVQHYQKDFVKLHNPKENEKDEETLRYFIEIFQKPKPCGKFKDFIKMVKENQENHYPMNNKIYSILKPVHVRCICFNNHNFEEYKDIQKEIS